jgi:hypothetical protein
MGHDERHSSTKRDVRTSHRGPLRATILRAVLARSPIASLAPIAALLAACAGRIRDAPRDAALDRAALDARSDGAVDVTALDVLAPDRVAVDAAPLDAASPAPCPAGQALCGGRCVALSEDLTNCGECGRVCAVPRSSARCSIGACRVGTCETGFGDCNSSADDGCESWLGSTLNCGRCGITCDAARPFCDDVRGECVTGCAPGLARCGPICVDATASVEHCGGCGRACSFANGNARCDAGRCALASCVDGYADCDGVAANGCETALSTAEHCARCGDRCDAAAPVCDLVARRCTGGCAAPTTRCGSLCVDRERDVEHCGACDRRCAFANATARCAAGVCALGACLPGFVDCDRDASNGCEVDTRSSLSSCGACGRACAPANAVAVCAGGACGYSSCSAEFGDCDRVAGNGCETSLSTSPAHCGACGNACRPINATPMCAAGRCGYGRCDAGFGDCDRVAGNGCETPIATSLSHCGACGAACVVPNAIAVCSAGRCDYRACQAPFADCDGNRSNGCEVDLASSSAHCGACNARCAAPRTCNAGVCQ